MHQIPDSRKPQLEAFIKLVGEDSRSTLETLFELRGNLPTGSGRLGAAFRILFDMYLELPHQIGKHYAKD